MTIFLRISDILSQTANGLASLIEAISTIFRSDPELRRKVAFSVALIALSAKMAKADGVVTTDEVRAFHEFFAVPNDELQNVTRLYNMAKQDIAGFEAYANQIGRLCGSQESNCPMLEDVLDALFHIAKADGVVHEREQEFLARIAEIFQIGEHNYAQIRARHVLDGTADPYVLFGLNHTASFDEVKRRYRQLVAENHPDRLQARGVPDEFLLIANNRLAAFNIAYEQLEKARRSEYDF